MEGLGEKFQKARAARNLTLDEAARMTKIRPSKLAEIEAEDFSQFPSLAYAKGFVLIYGKFLDVDVSPYLEAFETSEHMTVDGYSYLQDNPAPPPRRTEVVPRRAPGAGNKSSLLPLVIGIVVLVAGFFFLKLMMDLRRIKPASGERDAQALASASPVASVGASNQIVAPRALAADSTPAPTAPMTVAIAPSASPVVAAPSAAPLPTIAAIPSPAATEEDEPEVRRAEPVNPEDLAKARAALANEPGAETPGVNRFDIRPLKRTFVRVVVDGSGGASLERWLNVAEGPVQFRGKKINVKLLDPTSVEIRKNGKVIARGDGDVRLE